MRYRYLILSLAIATGFVPAQKHEEQAQYETAPRFPAAVVQDSVAEIPLFRPKVVVHREVMIPKDPFLGGALVPNTVKMGLGVVLTIVVWPLARGSLAGEIPYEAITFALLMLKEVFVGFAVGFVNAHIFWAMEMAGRIIDTVRGTSMAEVLVPHTKKRATPFGDLYYQMMLVFFVVLGGHRVFLDTFCFSFASIPLNATIDSGPGLTPFFFFMIRTTAEIFLIATLMAAPIMAATFITDVVFGILNRVAPQLNAYFMAMPVKAVAGVIMALVALIPFSARLEYYTVWTLEAVGDTLTYLAAAVR